MREYFKKQKEIENFVSSELYGEGTGHDSNHIKRVLSLALKIARKEKEVNYKVLISACLLHDISLSKGKQKNHHIDSAKKAKQILKKYNFNSKEIKKVYETVLNHDRGFSNKKNPYPLSKETKILCDADRLDGLGIIGIVRMIQFSAKQKVPLIKTKEDKLNESLYGNLKYLEKLGKDLLTREGEKIVKRKEKKLGEFIKDLEKDLSVKTYK